MRYNRALDRHIIRQRNWAKSLVSRGTHVLRNHMTATCKQSGHALMKMQIVLLQRGAQGSFCGAQACTAHACDRICPGGDACAAAATNSEDFKIICCHAVKKQHCSRKAGISGKLFELLPGSMCNTRSCLDLVDGQATLKHCLGGLKQPR